MNSNVLIDDAENGYLQINRFYEQTTIGANQDNRRTYTILKNSKFRYFNRSIVSNRSLEEVLPKEFGIANFIYDTINTSTLGYTCFYIEADIPREVTDTQLTLKLVPLGLVNMGDALTYRFSEYNDDNIFLYNFINNMVNKLSDDKTLSYLVHEKFDAITSKDKEIIDQFIKVDNQFKKIEDLSKLLVYLNKVYQLNSAITYRSVVLGWNPDKARFFVKNHIEYNNEMVPFRYFLENAEHYFAAQ